MPAFISSSLYLSMASNSLGSGETPASDSLLAFTITMTRICNLLSGSSLGIGRAIDAARGLPAACDR